MHEWLHSDLADPSIASHRYSLVAQTIGYCVYTYESGQHPCLKSLRKAKDAGLFRSAIYGETVCKDQMSTTGSVVVRSANDVAEEVRRQALVSAGETCYGVGGIIVENKTGKIIKAWGNRAQGKLKSGEFYPLDPSNH